MIKRQGCDDRAKSFEDDFECGVKKLVPLASVVRDMVKYLSVVVADPSGEESLRHGSSLRNGGQGTERNTVGTAK